MNEDGTRVGFCPLRNKADANQAFGKSKILRVSIRGLMDSTDFLVAEGWQGLDIRVSLIWKADLHSEEIHRKRGPEQSRRRRFVPMLT